MSEIYQLKQPPVPNRLVDTPPDLYGHIEKILIDGRDMTKRLRKVVNIAYGRGYMDGYRDGHTDAENGHDERVRAMPS